MFRTFESVRDDMRQSRMDNEVTSYPTTNKCICHHPIGCLLCVVFSSLVTYSSICLPINSFKKEVRAGHVAGLENIAKTGFEEPLSPEMRMSKNTTTLLKSR